MACTVVLLIVAVVVVGPLAAKEIVERPSYDVDVDDLSIINTELEDEKDIEDENQRGACKIKLPCIITGGSCVTNAIDCRYGRLAPSGCRGEGCQCCIPGCPIEDGFFWLASSSQCFKLMTDHPDLNWFEGKKLCENEMLKLAHPYDAAGLRCYLEQRYGDINTLLNARGNGADMIWQDSGVPIKRDNPLWRSQVSTSGISTSHCLITFTDRTQPNSAFWATGCSTESTRFTLCELDLSSPSG